MSRGNSLEDPDEAQAPFDRMAAAHVAGDEPTLDALITEELAVKHPALHKVLLVDRVAP